MRRSPTAQWWQYPLARPSYRFTQINNYVRQMDLRFAALPGPDKDDWQDKAERWYWFAQCVPWVFDYDPLEQVPSTGLAMYRAIQCSRLTQGLAVSDTPPIAATALDGDTLTPVGSGVFGVVWTRDGGDPGGSYFAEVRVKALNHEPESGPDVKRMTWAFGAAIVYGAQFDLSPIFDALPGLESMPAIAIALAICDNGAAPFVGRRAVFTAPY